jgi:hypothetical protein
MRWARYRIIGSGVTAIGKWNIYLRLVRLSILPRREGELFGTAGIGGHE